MDWLRLFPEIYMNGDRPARRGVVDKGRLSLPTPAYGFGWVLSSLELFEALDTTEEPPLKIWLYQLPEMVDDRVHARWEMMGYDDHRYNPMTPKAKTVGEDYTLILMACNDSHEVMDRIMADKAYHEECRNCLNNPKTMRLKPAWFRVGLRGVPKGFIPEDGGKLECDKSVEKSSLGCEA